MKGHYTVLDTTAGTLPYNVNCTGTVPEKFASMRGWVSLLT